MILLDTNVLLEPLRPVPEACVIAWIDAQALETLYLSTMTVATLRAGVAVLPKGKRRDSVHDYLEKHVLPLFVGRVLPFDMTCTSAYAKVMAMIRKDGSSIETAGAYIAAVALANGFIVATRNSGPFEVAGLTVINPWEA